MLIIIKRKVLVFPLSFQGGINRESGTHDQRVTKTSSKLIIHQNPFWMYILSLKFVICTLGYDQCNAVKTSIRLYCGLFCQDLPSWVRLSSTPLQSDKISSWQTGMWYYIFKLYKSKNMQKSFRLLKWHLYVINLDWRGAWVHPESLQRG